MQSGHELRKENASPVDLVQAAPPDLPVHIAPEIASVLGMLMKKMDYEVQKVCCEEGRGPMGSHVQEDLGTMTKKTVGDVRQTMEVAENV